MSIERKSLNKNNQNELNSVSAYWCDSCLACRCSCGVTGPEQEIWIISAANGSSSSATFMNGQSNKMRSPMN